MRNRLYFMDTVRSFTILLVVIFHLTLLYTEFTPVQNRVPEVYRGVFMGISSIINGPLLNSIMFFIAGFFAFNTYQRKGRALFFKNKLKKLGIPYLGGLIILAPLTQYIADRSWGKNESFIDYWLKGFFLPNAITPHHLWFIGILLCFFIISMPFLELLQNKKETRQKRPAKKVALSIFLLGTFLLYFGMNFIHKPYDFISLYIINFPPAVLPVYAAYFALGIYASFKKWFSDERNERVYPWAAVIYIISLTLYMGTFIIIPDAMASNHPLLAAAFTASLLSGVMLIVTVFKKYGNKETKFKSWISKNSYGAYIIHYFIVFFIVYITRDISLPIITKYIIQCIFCPCLIWVLSGLLKGYTPLKNIL